MQKMVSQLLGAALALPGVVFAVPWGDADPKTGGELHHAKCQACHVRMYGGDGSKMYTRDGRMMSSRLELLQRVAACGSTHNTGWFPDEEGSVAAYLNQQYYRFDQ